MTLQADGAESKPQRSRRWCSGRTGVLLALVVALLASVWLSDEAAMNATVLTKANFTALSLSPEQVQAYHRQGYLIVRGAVPRAVAQEVLRNRPTRMLPWWLGPIEYALNRLLQQINAQDSLWADSEFFYSFWRESPVAGLVHQLYPEADGVRLLVDLFVGFKREARPVVLGTYHQDTYSYGMISDDSPGISAWVPLADIDSKHGGSVWLVDMSKVPAECQRAPADTDVFSAGCEKVFDQVRVAPDWQMGDLLLFSKTVVHKSQPMLPSSPMAQRFSLVGRFTTSNGRIRISESNPGIKLKYTYCRHNLTDNAVIASPCYPQMHPKIVDSERRARDTGALQVPSNTVWFFKEVLRIALSGGHWY